MTQKDAGNKTWRSLDELAGTEQFQRFLKAEFPDQASDWTDPVSRRDLLKVMGASLMLAGLTACRPPAEKIVPYVRAPEEVVPGKPLFFATAMPLGGFARGLLVESHMGRPTKVEGNPEHPASLGATDVFGQASVLTLYDPDRSQVVTRVGRISSWMAFLAALNVAREEQHLKKGAGLRLLTGTVTSPTLGDQLRSLLGEFPSAKWHQYEPISRDNVHAGARLAFGQDVNTIYRIDKAQVILALDSDFLSWDPGNLRYAREFAAGRRVGPGGGAMNRLYVVESCPSVTGSMGDHRLRLRAGEVELFARKVAQQLRGQATSAGLSGAQDKFAEAVARDLTQHRGRSLVVAGDQQPPTLHALAHAINHHLGNVGQTVIHTDPVEAHPVDQRQSLRELVEDIKSGGVDLLVIVGGNPVFTAPRDLAFAEHLSKVKLRVHLGLYEDETSALCHWHIPEAHFLESWSDARAFDGTVSILQPLIAPLYGGKSAHELLAALAGKSSLTGHDMVRDYWKKHGGWKNFEESWQVALHDGLIAGTSLVPKRVTPRAGLLTESLQATQPASGIEIAFRPDPTIWDGSFANNGWLQELPKPLTKLTWDNAALVSPGTAQRLDLRNEEVVELRYRGASLRAAVWIMPGHADEAVTLHLGYGRTRAGAAGTGRGFNAYLLRTAGEPWFGSGLEIRKTGDQYSLVSTQHHFSMEGRNLIRAGTLGQFQRNPRFAQEVEEAPPPGLTLYPAYAYQGCAWGMAIDLNACIGCGACVLACQAENNIPVVGKTEAGRGRSMHWIRVDRYYEGPPNDPAIYHQPVPCMHCENAPCELVCPVGATVHSSEGLNQMVYNRCVGTRYCSNNCPYKVRRFNFFQFADWTTPSLKALRNPDVTVRSRGVMEKCTYCVQRINAAKIQAEKEDRKVRDGEIVTACQAVCPAQAIVFGDINDPTSRVARLKADPRNYGLLAELNTRPRTTYLARLRNPNPALEGESNG
jgi:molybdopterin-containing oxidoreductase family iron-sulfur binding subunit